MKAGVPNARSVGAILRHRLVRLALLAPLLGACVVPVPVPEWIDREVPDAIVGDIEPGTTSRADILLRLSEPWIRGAGDGYFVYSWPESLGGAGAFLVFYIPIGVSATKMRCHCLVIQFGDDGLVERVTVLSETRTHWSVDKFLCPGEQLKDTIQEWLAQSPARP